MAFWGIEVKPGKPYTHVHDNGRGALRVSQATLGNGTATKRSVVQCNVGNKSPVLLCSLIPDRVESCCLDLRFEEDDDVVFSVVGPRTVHLTGYFLGESGHGSGDADDSDSYGEDIWEMRSGESGSYSSEDEDDYESDFIDDGDIEMLPSPRPSSGVIIEEIVEDEKPASGVDEQHLGKKHQVDSDEGEGGALQQIIVKHNKSLLSESEDEDGFPISLGNKDNGKNVGDSKVLDADKKRKLDAILLKGSERKEKIDTVNNKKSKKKKKDKVESVKSSGANSGISSEQFGNTPSGDLKKDAEDKRDEAQSSKEECEKIDQEGHPYEVTMVEASGKLKKKKKEQVKREQTSETGANMLDDKAGEGDKEQMDKSGQESASGEKNTMGSSLSSATSVGNDKSKRKKKSTKDGNPVENENKFSRVSGEDGSDRSQKTETNENKLCDSQERLDEDRLVGELAHNTKSSTGADSTVANVSKKAKKKQKKNKKLPDNDSAGDKVSDLKNETPRKSRTFGNGLVIEELSMGQPDGKRASPGKTVFVRYIGKLRSGKIFDSNVGQRPFKFRLGVGQVIKGWDVGVDGMRIGDKRRLTIPPSMGYGEKGAGGLIPGNSWLTFDVELVDVK